MEEIIHVSSESNQTSSLTDYTESVVKCFDSVPEVAKPLIGSAGRLFNRIEKTLYSAPAFVSAVKAAIPEEAYQVILTDEQKTKIASGALKLMTKKDGSLMANLINPETKKIVSTVSLGKVKLSPELSQAMTNYATQMQMAQIAEQIQFVQVAVEEVRQGQEYDRLATAYSCQQKLIQAAAIHPHHGIAQYHRRSDGDCRNGAETSFARTHDQAQSEIVNRKRYNHERE